MNPDPGLFKNSHRVEPPYEDRSNATLAYRYFGNRLTRPPDPHESSQTYLLKLASKIGNQLPTLRWKLSEARTNPSIPGLHCTDIVSHAAANEYFKGINAGAIVGNNLNEPGWFSPLKLQKSSEAGIGRDTLFQQYSIQRNGAYCPNSNHAFLNGDMTSVYTGLKKRCEVPHCISLLEHLANHIQAL